MNKKLLLTSLLGATFTLTGCVNVTPEDKAFKSYEDIVKIAFEVKNEKELDSLVKDMKAKYDLIDFEDEIKDKDMMEIYKELFSGDKVIKEYADALEDADISFEDEDIRYEALDKEDFEIIANPKLYIGDGEYLKLKDMYLIFNKEPIEVQAYDKDDEEEQGTLEFVMPMIIDNKGNVKAFTLVDESDREFIEEFFLDKDGIGTFIKDIEDIDDSLNDLSALLTELDDYSQEDTTTPKEDTTTSKEDTDITINTDKENTSTSNVSKDSFVKLSGLNYDVDDEYATYEDSKTGLEIFVSFFNDGKEAIDIEIPTSNISDKEFNNQLKIAMNKVGKGDKELTSLKSKIDECLTEKFQNQSDIKAEIDKWDGMFVVDYYESDNLNIRITIYDAGSHNETVSVEFMQY